MSFVVVALQFLVGWFLGFGAIMIAPLPEGAELYVAGIGNIAGILLVGYAVQRVRPTAAHYVATGFGVLLGIVLIELLPPMGFKALLLPLLLGVAAYQLACLQSNKIATLKGLKPE